MSPPLRGHWKGAAAAGRAKPTSPAISPMRIMPSNSPLRRFMPLPPAGSLIKVLRFQVPGVLPDEVAADEIDIGPGQSLRDRSRHRAVAYHPAVEAADRTEAEAGRGDEDLVRVRRIEQVAIGLPCRNPELGGEIEHGGAADARQDVAFLRGDQRPIRDQEDVAAGALGEISA